MIIMRDSPYTRDVRGGSCFSTLSQAEGDKFVDRRCQVRELRSSCQCGGHVSLEEQEW